MTTEADYTPDEWDLILQAPALAGLFLIQADWYSPPVVARKTFVLLRAITAAVPPEPGSALIAAVSSAVLTGQAPRWSTAYPPDLDTARHWTLERCRQIARLLAQKTPEAEAEAFTRWLLSIGQQVALAADAPGLLDQRGGAVQPPTRRALEQLAAALDMPAGVVVSPR